MKLLNMIKGTSAKIMTGNLSHRKPELFVACRTQVRCVSRSGSFAKLLNSLLLSAFRASSQAGPRSNFLCLNLLAQIYAEVPKPSSTTRTTLEIA